MVQLSETAPGLKTICQMNNDEEIRRKMQN